MNRFLSRPFVFLIRLYQKYLSPHKAPSCRFTPTCSSYAVTAFEEWGPLVGLALAFWRIIRCNPFSKGGYDPVPLRKRRKKKEGEALSVSDVPERQNDGDMSPHDQT